MSQQKKTLQKELNFIKHIFSVASLNAHMKINDNPNDNDEVYSSTVKNSDKDNQNKMNRAHSLAELEEKLQKVKSNQKFNLKKKLEKKSLVSKLNKKIKKNERKKNEKVKKEKVKMAVTSEMQNLKTENKTVQPVKPIFNNEGKLVFSKFDFGNEQKGKAKGAKDPKIILQNLQKQEEKLKKIEESEDSNKVKEIKEKMAWKNLLQKAEGQKIKDDPILLKKTIKKMDQKKKKSKKEWDNRISNVNMKKEDRQKKRRENIAKKKKEKKSKLIKTAAKRGRVVI